ncbi:MAG: metallophosphoesterase [Ginsengibacter sp.]
MKTPFMFFVVVAIMLLLDLYIFMAIKSLSASALPKTRSIIFYSFWFLTLLTVSAMTFLSFGDPKSVTVTTRSYIVAVVMGLTVSKIAAVTFFLIDDIRRIVQWLVTKSMSINTETSQINNDKISRSEFLSWMGVAAGSTLFGSLIYGFSNKYNYTVKRIKLSYDNLPAAFKGFKIVFISDIHAGSLTDKHAVKEGVDKILAEKADMAIFSGDLVNDRSSEMDDYKDIFGKIKAPYGVFSTLGNHDYGDYVQWPYQGVSKVQNLENLKKVHADMGWKLMMNEHAVLEKDGDQIAVIGVENWGAKARFPKFGDLKQAAAGTEKYPFKILISHDPSHWDAQVRPLFPDIDLTVSGHTHGMQYGLDIPGFKWSPVQYVYKQWKGLYEQGKQKLYVNTGFGFIGYPGRVGILPEITVIELV